VASVPAGDEFGKAKLASFFCCLAQLAMDKAVRDEISAILGRWDGKRGENGRDGTSCEKVVGAAV
jgi:hypothetical protein